MSMKSDNPMHYPFAALVGQQRLQTALLIGAVDPGIGGVLICGEKGTAKSTAARALADVLPPIRCLQHCPYNSPPEDPHYGIDPVPETPLAIDRPVPLVQLPLGATEDRVLGTLDLQSALREGRRSFQPGLLAQANRGILYIDEINLLADHLVDLLLDAAASGRNVVQRDGIEVTHPARFLLIGTMNPEEGELRPQLLDRFGLMVDVASPQDAATRVEVLRRCAAMAADPAGFLAQWQTQQQAVRGQVAAAMTLLGDVHFDDELLLAISQLCADAGVAGLRADIAIHRASRALAALDGRAQVTPDDVRLAAELALPHRRRRQPFERPGLDPSQLDQHFPPTADQPPPPPPPMDAGRDAKPMPSPPESAEQPADDQPDHESCADHEASDASPGERADRMFQGQATPVAPPPPPANVRPVEHRADGRRNAAARRQAGRCVGALPDPQPNEPAVVATLRHAALRGAGAAAQGRPRVGIEDLHRKVRLGSAGTLILLVVDASGSMAARRRMEAVKGAVLGLLLDAYQQRDRVAVIAFRGDRAELILPPTGSVQLAERALQAVPTGGRTPLAHALKLAAKTAADARRSDPDLLLLTTLLTDGKANVAVDDAGGDPWLQSLQAARQLGGELGSALVLDTEDGFVRLGRARQLAEALEAEYRPLAAANPDGLHTTLARQRDGLRGTAPVIEAAR